MWFKQLQLFELKEFTTPTIEELVDKLTPLEFTPCLPSLPSSMGWVPPVEEDDAPLIHAVNGYIMLCLQIEEKILPAAVIRQALNDQIKAIETTYARKVRQKEKLALKDEMIQTLLPRAFSKLTRLYAYIDTNRQRLVLSTTNKAKTEQFIGVFKKSVTETVQPIETKKLAPIVTHWLKEKSNPSVFSIEKNCVLQDPQQQKRVIRCQQQDLFAGSIQSLLKEGCEAKELALCWHDRIHFVLADDFSLRSIQFQDEIRLQSKELEAETKLQQFNADFFIMTETLTGLLDDLSSFFT
jgi:recombination associated protein RdgC